MGLGRTFGEAFLDGFTMTGFAQRIDRPEEYTRLLEPPVDETAWSPWIFEIGAGSDARVALSGDLHRVPEAALQEMLRLLEGETANRKAGSVDSAHNFHGAS